MSNTTEYNIEEIKTVVEAMYASAMSVMQIEQRSVYGGVFLEFDWETNATINIAVDRGFLEFFDEHRASVLRCFIVRAVFRHFVPGYIKPSEEELETLGWPYEWTSKNMLMMSTLIT